jgi:hypothetical protein
MSDVRATYFVRKFFPLSIIVHQSQVTMSSVGMKDSLLCDIAKVTGWVWGLVLILGWIVLICQVSVFFLKNGNDIPLPFMELVSKLNENKVLLYIDTPFACMHFLARW